MGKYNSVKVFAPASVANVAVGYDILGCAIDALGDEIIVKRGTSPGLKITAIHKNKTLSKDIMQNTAGYAALQLMKSIGAEDEAVEFTLIKNMAIGTGLGSSASSAVAGAFAMNEFLGRPYTKRELLRFAVAGEQIADGAYHADNVAPSLMGSFCLIRDNDDLDVIKLPVPAGLKVIIVRPNIEILTKNSRLILSDKVLLRDHIKQSGNLGAFVSALFRLDFDLMQRALKDYIIEPQRAALIPDFYNIQKIALEQGALGCSISGAGPSIFSLAKNSIVAENIYSAWQRFYSDKNEEAQIFISNIDREGARIY